MWKFLGLQNLATCKFRKLRNFATCEISQVANFRNLRNFAGCQFSQPANTAHTCTSYMLFDPLVDGFIQVYPYMILILKHTFVISSLLSLYKLNHACNQINFLSFNQLVKHEASSFPAVGDFFFFPPYLSCIFLVAKHPLMMTNQEMLG